MAWNGPELAPLTEKVDSVLLKAITGRSLWHLAGLAGGVLLTVQLLMGSALLDLQGGQRLFTLVITGAFIAGSIVNIVVAGTVQTWVAMLLGPVVAVLAFGAGALVFTMLGGDYVSRTVLLLALGVACVVFGLAVFVRRLGFLVAICAVFIGIIAAMQGLDGEPRRWMLNLTASNPLATMSKATLRSQYYPLQVQYFDYHVLICPEGEKLCRTPRNGGGIDVFGEGYIIATGEGRLFRARLTRVAALDVKPLPWSVPINDGDFADSGESDYGKGVFRTTDILVRKLPDMTELYASHHYYHVDQDCVALRVSRLPLGSDAGAGPELSVEDRASTWETIYETQPCMPRSSGERSPDFHGEEAGGKLAFLDGSTLLVTVGDHHFDGWNADVAWAQDTSIDYGKTITIDVNTGQRAVFSLGHRNPQGLVIESPESIWTTEHGPSGGDELNHIVRGGNYGWPYATYGTEYGMRTWPVSRFGTRHGPFERPAYSWVPSIAVSNLIVLKGTKFLEWQGDLMIASYKQSLHRARIEDGRIVTLEPITLRRRNGRIRDLIEDGKGRIVLWFDTGAVAFLQPNQQAGEGKAVDDAESVQGEDGAATLFGACAGCHVIADGTKHGVGPDLGGLFSRAAGQGGGFGYSHALSVRGGAWDDESLNAFLANPVGYLPGTSMQFAGVADPEVRAKLIEYLRHTAE